MHSKHIIIIRIVLNGHSFVLISNFIRLKRDQKKKRAREKEKDRSMEWLIIDENKKKRAECRAYPRHGSSLFCYFWSEKKKMFIIIIIDKMNWWSIENCCAYFAFIEFSCQFHIWMGCKSVLFFHWVVFSFFFARFNDKFLRNRSY